VSLISWHKATMMDDEVKSTRRCRATGALQSNQQAAPFPTDCLGRAATTMTQLDKAEEEEEAVMMAGLEAVAADTA